MSNRLGMASRVALVALLGCPPLGAAEGPWRLREAAQAPSWLDLAGTYRVRYEALSSSLRPGVAGSDQLLAERLLLAARVGGEKLFAKLELEDSRTQLDDADTPLGTDDVNAAEILQAHAGLGFSDALRQGDRLDFQAGRMTLDLGSRRLVARNSFRNTINGFTGVHASWRGPGAQGATGGGAEGGKGVEVRLLLVAQVDRLPTDRDRLDDNDVELDRDNSRVRFWGLHVSHPRLAADLRGEVYLLGLRETDRPSAPTSNRDLVTGGFRLLRPPAAKRWDFEVETALQVGDSRRSPSAADRADLDHEGWFAHLHAGHTLAARGAPRLVLQYDYASGDDDPNDERNGRFDTLYGARRFEFGPTGIFGFLARSNISSPGGRVEFSPRPGWSLMTAHRAAWLASRRDALTTNGMRDPEGASGSFIGHLLEAQLRVNLLPGNLDLELGAALLFAGEFLTAQSPALDDLTYAYLQTAFTF
jgi:hypothetical protein